MTTNNYFPFITGLLICTIVSCSQSNTRQDGVQENLPPRIKNLENLTAYSPDNQAPDTVELVQEQIFEGNDSLYIKSISDIEVDGSGRVYVNGSFFDEIGIYVFEPGGNFIATIGRKGRGPGEFLSVSDMVLKHDQLFIYDTRQKKISIFSVKDLDVLDELILGKNWGKNISETARLMPGAGYLVKNDTTILMRYKTILSIVENRIIRFYAIDPDGTVRPDYILEQQDNRRYFGGRNDLNSNGYYIGGFVMPFNRSSLIAITDRDSIYSAWTEDFLIKVHGPDGKYERAIFYPLEKVPLDMNTLDEDPIKIELVEETSPPDTWPALHHMVMDDQNRIWAFTITDSDSTYQGWVLNSSGALLAKFQWPGNKKSRLPHIPRDIKIKDGYLYKVISDYRKQINQVVKYKINFKER